MNCLFAGYADSWRFTLARLSWWIGFRYSLPFSAALDITLQRRERNRVPEEKYWDEDAKKYKKLKEIYYVWVQGSAFDFREGYTIHRKDGGLLAQIEKASPAIPAAAETKYSWATPPQDWREMARDEENKGRQASLYEDRRAPPSERWKLRVMTKRNPGFVRMQTYIRDSGPTTWKKDQLLDMTQDELVAFLITG
jgi:hypothetical protein